MYICTYVHVYIYIDVCVLIHMYIYIYIYLCIYCPPTPEHHSYPKHSDEGSGKLTGFLRSPSFKASPSGFEFGRYRLHGFCDNSFD